MKIRFVIARGRNKRPTLQHAVHPSAPAETVCGVSLLGWSRAYQAKPIPEVLCRRCQKRAG